MKTNPFQINSFLYVDFTKYIGKKSTWLLKIIFTLSSLLIYNYTPGQTFLIENFSTASGSNPPSGWLNIAGASGGEWTFNEQESFIFNYPLTHPIAYLDASAFTQDSIYQEVALETPVVNTASANFVLLSFDHYYSQGVGALGKIQVSTDYAVWQDVYIINEDSKNPDHIYVNLPQAVGKTQVWLRFVWTGYNNGVWAIDNVKVYATQELDAGITSLDSPVMPFSEGLSDIQVTLANYGYSELTSTKIMWSVNGTIQNPDGHLWNGNLNYGQEQPGLNLGTYEFAAGSRYQVKIWTEGVNGTLDYNSSNDTLIRILTPSLCGTYTIGGENPDFVSFSEAVSMLTNSGVACPVTFKVRDGEYIEQLEIYAIPGSSAINTVKFESEGGDSSTVRLMNSPFAAEIITLRLSGASNLIFSKMEIMNNTYGYGAIVTEGFTNNIHISNCIINANFYSHGIRLKEGSSNITISDNFINGLSDGWDGISIAGSENVIIKGNQIFGFKKNYYFGVGLRIGAENTNLIIEYNRFNCYNNAAILCESPVNNLQIINNRITDSNININEGSITDFTLISGNRIVSSTTSGIKLNGKNILLANNYITIKGIENHNAIEIGQTENLKILHNNVNITNTNFESVCLLFEGGISNQILNNNFVNEGGGTTLNITDIGVSNTWDYNNYYSPYSRLGLIFGKLYNSMDSIKNNLLIEKKGVSVNPFYSNDSILIPHQVLLNNAGIATPEGLFDIDSLMRNSETPDIGASEFSACLNDAGINSIIFDVSNSEGLTKPVKTILQNQGMEPISELLIQWKINGVAQTPVQWTGFLDSYGNDSIILGDAIINEGMEYQIIAWTELNGDCDFVNDTTEYRVYTSLCGEYTIGGTNPDFETIDEAVNFMNLSGISCPVIFNIRDGEYNVQLQINTTVGASDENYILFRSESGNPENVIVTNLSNEKPTLVVNNAQHLIFEALTIRNYTVPSMNPDDSWYAMIIQNKSINITIRQCRILGEHVGQGIKITGNSSNISIIGNEITKPANNGDLCNGISWNSASNILIRDNYILNYTRGIFGESQNPVNVKIENNRIENCKIEGIMIMTSNDTLLVNNNHLIDTQTNFTNSGEQSYIEFQRNRIETNITSGLNIHTNRGFVAYNLVTVKGDIPLNGFNSQHCTNLTIANNTFNITNTNVQTNALAIASAGNNSIINNIFAGTGQGFNIGLVHYEPSDFWDYNCYYNPNGSIAQFEGQKLLSIIDWQNFLTSEYNSVSCNPFFIDLNNLMPSQSLLYQAGAPIANLVFDFDSTAVNTDAPSMGALEFVLCNPDAGINDIFTEKTFQTQDSLIIKAVIHNHGLDTLHTAILQWKINDVDQELINWSGQLANKMSEEIILDTLVSIPAKMDLVVWISNPNEELTDCKQANDTLKTSIYTSLCGEYTIGGEFADFTSFNEANFFLKRAGIQCPVIFNVADGTYNEFIEFNEIPGSSSMNTITFRPASGDSGKVILSTIDEKPTVLFNNAQHIVFEYIIFKQLSPNGNVNLLLENGSENIRFSKCSFITPYYGNNIRITDSKTVTIDNSLITPPDGMESGGPALDIARSKNIILKGNSIQNYSWGAVTAWGEVSHIYFEDNVISKILFGFTSYQGYDSIYITGNTFDKSRIYLNGSEGVNGISFITGNKFTTSENHSAILLRATTSLVANNYITVSGTNSVNGIELDNCYSTKIYYNSINVLSNNLTSTSRSIRINGGENLDIRNNIFNNSGVGFCAWVDASPVNSQWDYNNYFSPYSYIGYVNSQAYNSLSEWGKAINGEANGIDSNPFFNSDTDLTPNQILVKDAGTFLPDVSEDIDGEPRPLPETKQILKSASIQVSLQNSIIYGSPDIGAKQFSLCDLDAGINLISTPRYPIEGGLQPVKVILQNHGLSDLTTVKINCTINGYMLPEKIWEGYLATAQNVEISLGSFHFISGGKYEVSAWTSLPNQTADCDNHNDKFSLVFPGILLPNAAGLITGPTSLCLDQAVQATYSVDEINNADYYIWTLAEGMEGSSQTNSIEVSFPGEISGSITVKGMNGNGEGQASELHVQASFGPTPPPSGVTATDGTYCDRVVVTWDMVTVAASYNLYKDSKLLISGITETSYDDLNAPPTNSIYSVSAVGVCGESAKVSDSGFRCVDPPTVVSPSQKGVIWQLGQTYEITWKGFTDPYVRIEIVKGSEVVRAITTATPNDGTMLWKVSNIEPGNEYKIRVTSTKTISMSDESDQTYSIFGPPVVEYPSASSISWIPGNIYEITWKFFTDPYVKIELLKGEKVVRTITSGTANDGTMLWRAPSIEPGSDYRIRITSTVNPVMTDISDNHFTLAPAITAKVNYPSDPGIVWNPGTIYEITWQDFTDPYVKLELLKGETVVRTITTGTANDGTMLWRAPSIEFGADYRIRITSTATPSMSDISDNYFTLAPAISSKIIYPSDPGIVWNPGTIYEITWQDFTDPYVKLELLKGETVVRTITTGTANDGTMLWRAPSIEPGTDYRIRITSTANPAVSDISDNYFTLELAITAKVTYPSDPGIIWNPGTIYEITWQDFTDPYVKLELLKGATVVRTITTGTANDGTMLWRAPSLEPGNDYRIRITSTSNPAVSDISDNHFTLASAITARVTYPSASGIVWNAGTIYEITWQDFTDPYVKLELLKGETVVRTITSATANDGAMLWRIASTLEPGTDYRVRITSTATPAMTDVSDNPVTIVVPKSATALGDNPDSNSLSVYPNPFSNRAIINYTLAEAGHTLLEIYDLTGRRVTILEDATREAGTYVMEWNAIDAHGQQVVPGVYLVRIQSGGFVQTEKIVFNK